MKRHILPRLWMVGALVAVVVLSGCGGRSAPTSSSSDQPAPVSSSETPQSAVAKPGPDTVVVSLTIPEDRSDDAVVSVDNHGKETYFTGYSFYLFEQTDAGEWTPLKADIYVSAIGLSLSPDSHVDHPLDAHLFQSGKRYQATWEYEVEDSQPKQVFYSACEVTAP